MPATRRRTVRLALAAAVAISVTPWAVTPADAAAQATGNSVGSAAPGVVYHGDALVPFLTAMRTQRVDIAGIGDSNQILGGTYGHDHGQQEAWSDRVGLYGSGLIPVNAAGGYQGPLGYNYSGGLGGVGRAQSEIPAPYSQYVLPYDVGIPGPALYLAQGDTISANGSPVAFGYDSTAPWGLGAAVRWHLNVGTTADPSMAGSISPSARIAATGNILATQTYSTYTGVNGLADLTLSVPGDSNRTGTLWFEPTKLFDKSVTGPLFATNSRIEVTGKTSGVAYSTLLYQGGKATRDAAVALQQSSDTALAEWMREAVALQAGGSADKRLLVQIIQGGNDRSNTQPSVGPNPAETGTPAGYKDNLTAVWSRLKTAWAAAGYDPSKLNLMIGAYHAQDFDRTRFAAFEQAAMDFADSHAGVTVIRGTKMLSGSTMLANGWYRDAGDGTADLAHMSGAGYEAVGRLTVNQMLSLLGDGSPARSNVSSLSFTLSEDPAASLRPDYLALVNVLTGQAVAAADTSVDYDAATKTATWTFPGLDGDVLAKGQYQATLTLPGAAPSSFVVAAVPEPTSAAAVAVVGAGLLARRRRRVA